MAYKNGYKPNNNFKSNNKGYNKNYKQEKKKKPTSVATAPFNFIRFPDEAYIRYKKAEDLPKFDKYYKDLNTGYIDYEFTCETPMFVGSEKKKDSLNNIDIVDFFKNSDNKFCVPGSSIRGVIRSNTEILGFSYPEFVEDKLFLYRKFASADSSKDQYKEVISLKKGESIDNIVMAGYIKKEKGSYYLYPAKKINNKSFFPISETKLRQKNLPENKVNYMYNKSLLNFKGKGLKEWTDFAKRNSNKGYKPYSINISFYVDDENHFKDISTNNKLKYKGILCNCNHLGSKKKHYIINEIDENYKPIEIDSREIIAYKNDCETNKQRTNPDYYLLPGEKDSRGHIIENPRPFFYKIENGKVAYFGRTPYLRIFYKQSVRECINTKFSKGIDYANAIYGYTVDNKQISPLNSVKYNFKSRVSFMDAICENPKIIKEVKYLNLASPKSSCYNLYLSQRDVKDKNEINTYSSKGTAKLRGYKFYWHHRGNISLKEICLNAPTRITSNIVNIVDKGSKFNGRVYFNNLTDDELGLLLLSIKYNDKSRESIGMAKGYGLGKVDFNKVDLYLEDISSKFTSFNDNYKKINIEDINEFKYLYMDYIDDVYVLSKYKKTYEELSIINDYLDSKEIDMDSKNIKYMDLKDFRYSPILPEAYDVKR